jgi:DNA-binding Xre family transcriptional regulator
MCITVKLNDGMLFEYDSQANTIRRIRPTNYSKDADVLKRDIGNNLQKIVSARAMSQSEIASKAGITEAMLSRYIHGTSMPGVDKVYGLAAALGCRVVDILGEAYEDYDT